MNRPPIDRYTPVAIAFHWLLAFAIVGSFGMGLYMSDLAMSPTRLKLFKPSTPLPSHEHSTRIERR